MIRIIAGKNTGKTYKLLEEASKTNGTVICSNPHAMAEKARAYGFKGINFIAYTDFFLYKSNCNINNDYEEGSLFYDSSASNKRIEVKKLLVEQILAGVITDNISGMKLTMRLGCEPKIFVEVIDELLKGGKINVDTSFNRTSAGVHKVKKYQIEVK